jgi:hypothetical protein
VSLRLMKLFDSKSDSKKSALTTNVTSYSERGSATRTPCLFAGISLWAPSMPPTLLPQGRGALNAGVPLPPAFDQLGS